jgi:hypothetical protein
MEDKPKAVGLDCVLEEVLVPSGAAGAHANGVDEIGGPEANQLRNCILNIT